MNKKTRNIILANLGLILATLIWGFAFVVVKNSLDLIPPIYLTALRFSVAAIACFAVFFKRIDFKDTKMLLEGAFLGALLFLGYSFQTVGCNYTTASKNAFLTSFYVLIVPLFSWFLTKSRPDIFCIVTAVFGIIGVGFICLDNEGEINIGDILTLACAVFYAIHMVFLEKYNKHRDPAAMTTLQMTSVAILAWIAAPIYDGALSIGVFTNPSAIVSILYLGLLSTMLAYLLQNASQKVLSASNASLVMSLESLFGAVFSTIFLPDEHFTLKMIIGAVLLMGAIILSQTKPKIGVK